MWDARIRSRSLHFGSSTIGSWNWYVQEAQGNHNDTLWEIFLMYSGTEPLLGLACGRVFYSPEIYLRKFNWSYYYTVRVSSSWRGGYNGRIAARLVDKSHESWFAGNSDKIHSLGGELGQSWDPGGGGGIGPLLR